MHARTDRHRPRRRPLHRELPCSSRREWPRGQSFGKHDAPAGVRRYKPFAAQAFHVSAVGGFETTLSNGQPTYTQRKTATTLMLTSSCVPSHTRRRSRTLEREGVGPSHAPQSRS